MKVLIKTFYKRAANFTRKVLNTNAKTMILITHTTYFKIYL